MPQHRLDYQRPIHDEGPALAWYRSDVLAAAVTLAIIVSVNVWLVCKADKDWGFAIWVLVYIPLANALLAVLLLASTPLVRRVSGMSASLHVGVTLVGCLAAIVIDAVVIFV